MCNGPYSLERFEKYKTVKIRPAPLPASSVNSGSGQLTYIAFSWKDLEAQRGEYTLEEIGKAIGAAVNPVLVLKPEPPAWVERNAERYFASFIRKVGSCFGADRRLAAVVISTLADRQEEWNAYMDSFESVPILADLHDAGLILHLKEHGREFGLRVTCSEQTWIECCEAFARQSLQQVWKRSPVVLHITDPYGGPHIRREARRWHASLANADIGLGYRLALRRLTFPEAVHSRGSLPLRFWFVNTGSSRVYGEFDLSIRLRQQHARHEIPIRADTESWLIGDIVHNEIAALPDLPPGTYQVSLGLSRKDRTAIPLLIQGEAEDGYYELGSIQVERAEDDDPFTHIWDDYYPEGYYPLEDPKVPQQ